MGTVSHLLYPDAAKFLGANFPAFKIALGSNFPVDGLYFDASTQESAFWKFIAENYGSGNITIDIWWYADTASSGTVVWEAQLSAITPNTDSQNIETDGLATLNYVQDTHLGTTGQRVHHCQITLSNLDSLTADDLCHLRIARDADGTNAADSMTGDAILLAAKISYSDS